MSSDHLEAFVRESREDLVALNNALLALEEDPDDRAALDVVFRTAHTLKGNFAALGFDEAAELAHAMEDLLEAIRAGQLAVTTAAMDRLFDAVDELEAAVEAIDRDGEPAIDAGESRAALRRVLEEGARAGEGSPSTVASGSDFHRGRGADQAVPLLDRDLEVPAADEVWHVRVSVADGDMQGVDAMLVVEAAAGSFDLLTTSPERAVIEDGGADDGFELLLGSGEGADVEAFFGDIASVTAVDAEVVTDRVIDGGEEDGRDETTASEGESVDAIRSVRVDVDQLDELSALVEQLVTSRITLRRSVGSRDERAAERDLDELDTITDDLRDAVMDIRLIPLRKVVETVPRLVRDLARDLDKEVAFSMAGTDVELDRKILDAIGDPLMHVVRNAIDHGIEAPDARVEAGKPRAGRLTLTASRHRDQVHIVVEDDGAGIDPDAIRAAATAADVADEEALEAMDDAEVIDLIFHPGFSTAPTVTDLSGRGVGMDVVRDTVERLDGDVSVESTPGEGTRVTLRLPISIAIVRVLFVEVGERRFGVPIKDVDEITPITGVETVKGDPVIDHDGRLYPVLDLRDRLTEAGPVENGEGLLLRIRASQRAVALRCDGVDRQEEVVAKPFDGILRDVPGISGTAVVGGGEVVPIIDVESV